MKYRNNNELYFFLKCYLYGNSKITLYKLNKKQFLNDNNNIKDELRYDTDKIFEENEILSFDFSFIWFAQKNNNELLFFKEEDDIFDLVVYNFEEKKVLNHKKINLIKTNSPRVANYVNKVIYNRYLIYTNENLLFIIDVELMEIIAIKELNQIICIYISDDDLIWTVENNNLNNYNMKRYGYNYLKQYFLDKKYLELIKIGEREMTNTFVKNILPLVIIKKILIFVENRKVELLSRKI